MKDFYVSIPSNNLSTANNVAHTFSLAVQPYALRFPSNEKWKVGMNSILLPSIKEDALGTHALFVYCNVVERIMVGQELKRLLGVVQLVNDKRSNKLVQWSSMEYKNVVMSTVSRLDIEIRDELNQPVHFEDGAVVINLHFTSMDEDGSMNLLLMSNNNNVLYPRNTNNVFRTFLEPPLQLDPDIHEVAMTQLILPSSKTGTLPKTKRSGILMIKRRNMEDSTLENSSVEYLALKPLTDSVEFVKQLRDVLNYHQANNLKGTEEINLVQIEKRIQNGSTFYEKVAGTEKAYYIPKGNYTPFELIDWINTNVPEVILEWENHKSVARLSIKFLRISDKLQWGILTGVGQVVSEMMGITNALVIRGYRYWFVDLIASQSLIYTDVYKPRLYPGRVTVSEDLKSIEVGGAMGIGVTKDLLPLLGWSEKDKDLVPYVTKEDSYFGPGETVYVLVSPKYTPALDEIVPPDYRYYYVDVRAMKVKAWGSVKVGSSTLKTKTVHHPAGSWVHADSKPITSDAVPTGFVYSNIISKVRVANVFTSLLNVFNGKDRVVEYVHPVYRSVSKSTVQEIEVLITDEQGRPYPLDQGVTGVHLRIRRKKV